MKKIGLNYFIIAVFAISTAFTSCDKNNDDGGKSTASILYRENYKISTRYLPPLSCLIPYTLRKTIPQCSGIQGIYVIICLFLRSNRQSLSRQQGMILIKTANAVATIFYGIHTMNKKRIFSGRQGFLKANPNKKESGMACYYLQRAVWQDSGINTLEMNRVIESYCLAASASLPLPRQAAKTLVAICGQRLRKKKCFF